MEDNFAIKQKLKAVLFDLDGTLIHSKGIIGDCINRTLEKFGFNPIDRKTMRGLIGTPLPGIFEIGGVKDKQINDEMVIFYRDLYLSEYWDKTYIFDGMIDVLKKLKNKGIKICVVTLKNGDVARRVVNEIELDLYVDLVVGDGDTIRSKPSPDQIIFACNKFEVNIKESVIIGDSIVDILSGKRAGCLTIGVLWGFSTENELLNVGADYLVKNIYELEKLLGL